MRLLNILAHATSIGDFASAWGKISQFWQAMPRKEIDRVQAPKVHLKRPLMFPARDSSPWCESHQKAEHFKIRKKGMRFYFG